MAQRKSKPMLMTKIPDGTVTAGEAASRLGVTRATILNWFADGKIRGWRNAVNRRVRVFEQDVVRIIRESMALVEKENRSR